MASRPAGPLDWETARSAVRRSFERNRSAWAVQLALAQVGAVAAVHPAPPAVSLRPPTERAALADLDACVAWAAAWRERDEPCVVWDKRSWASVGDQELPVRLAPATPVEAARLAGQARAFNELVERLADLLERWRPAWAGNADSGPGHLKAEATLGAAADRRGGAHTGADRAKTEPAETAGHGQETAPTSAATSALAQALRRHANGVGQLDRADFARLGDVVDWLVANPESGLYVRQLPIRGVDSKWLERHRGVVKDLVAAVAGVAGDGLGVIWRPPALVRGRFLDPALAPEGVAELGATPEGWDG
ncbi:MAG: DUF3322 domain-containing protein, partial [Bifidobacteriaceae bacterium]|nr:DUF3322 domain-containing protein [Bifidobacteriaceae bacterium]